MLVPSRPDDPAHDANVAAWVGLAAFDRPFLCAFSDGDPITKGADRNLKERIPGRQGQPHTTIVGGGHFLQEDCGEELARGRGLLRHRHPVTDEHSVVIVGAGFSGIGMAARLRAMGIDDFVVLDRGNDLGGTWRDNSYPGCLLRRPLQPLLVLLRAQSRTGRAPSPRRARSGTTCAPASTASTSGGHLRFGRAVDEARWDDGHRALGRAHAPAERSTAPRCWCGPPGP